MSAMLLESELRERMVSCEDHVFLRCAKLGSVDDGTDGKGVSIEQWLEEVNVRMQNRNAR
jgi:hypothetical protein